MDSGGKMVLLTKKNVANLRLDEAVVPKFKYFKFMFKGNYDKMIEKNKILAKFEELLDGISNDKRGYGIAIYKTNYGNSLLVEVKSANAGDGCGAFTYPFDGRTTLANISIDMDKPGKEISFRTINGGHDSFSAVFSKNKADSAVKMLALEKDSILLINAQANESYKASFSGAVVPVSV